MAIPTREQADEILTEIRAKRGYISDEDRANTPPTVLKALHSVRLEVASISGLLARNLFSSDARFAYELIQNAEDNQYAHEGINYLSFTILPDTLIIESNEIGFTERDVRAICSTAQSSKAQGQGYIGQKGVGFKSVFKVANRVTIHSGPFCFAFEYDTKVDGSGLGLITPLPVSFQALPAGVGTRMTLRLTRTLSGEIKPASGRVEFAIIDGEEYAGLFPDCHTLAFTLVEVNYFRPFLDAMDLGSRYTSVLVVEKTTVAASHLCRPLTQLLRSRAYALYGCCVAYASSKSRQVGMALLLRLQ